MLMYEDRQPSFGRDAQVGRGDTMAECARQSTLTDRLTIHSKALAELESRLLSIDERFTGPRCEVRGDSENKAPWCGCLGLAETMDATLRRCYEIVSALESRV